MSEDSKSLRHYKANRESINNNRKAIWADRVANGLCGVCGAQALKDKSMCQTHTDANRAKNKARSDELKKLRELAKELK